MDAQFWAVLALAGGLPNLPVANAWYRAPNIHRPQRRYAGNASNPGLRNCNLLACICVCSVQTVARAFQGPWEEHFIVVQWEQRGAGKTYANNA
jgi:hypothetical protein